MGAKVEKTDFSNLNQLQEDLKELKSLKIIVGPACEEDSDLAKYAAANEFGATIKPKKKFLAVPCHPAAKGKSPKDFTGLIFIKPKGEKTPFLAKKEGDSLIPYFWMKKEIKIPERAYLRTTFKKKETADKATRILSDSLNRLIAGSVNAKDVADAVGASFASCVKETIGSNIGDPNSKLTVMMKGGGKGTLVDTGRLLKSIQWEVLSNA